MDTCSLKEESNNKLNPKEQYENCILVGIKILDSKEELEKKFGSDFASAILKNDTEIMEYDQVTAENILGCFTNLDGYQWEINKEKGNIDLSKKINFELIFETEDKKIHKAEFKDFQIGTGNLTKGFGHLLTQSNQIDLIKSSNKLDRICQIPSELTLAKLGEQGYDLINSFEKAIPKELSPEAHAFLSSFIKNVLSDGAHKERMALLNTDRDIKIKEQLQQSKEPLTQEQRDKTQKGMVEKKMANDRNNHPKKEREKEVSNEKGLGVGIQ